MSATAKSLKKPSNVITAAIFLVLLAVPMIVPPFRVQTWAVILTFALLALAVDLVWGYTGMLTFGHAAFFGAGAYLTAKLLTEVPAIPSFIVVFIFAPVFAAALTFSIGWFLFSADISGVYFAIATLIIAIVFERIAGEFTGFLGGFNGLSGIPPLAIGSFEFSMAMSYYAALAVLVLVFLGSQYLTNSAFGRVLRGIRENKERTEFFGYQTGRYRLIVFTLSGAIAGIGGGLYATIDGFVSPPLLGFVLSTQAIIWVAVGGRGTLIGALAGALLIQYLEVSLSAALVEWWQFILAVLFIIVVVAAPGGLVGISQKGYGKLRERFQKNAGTTAQAEGEPND